MLNNGEKTVYLFEDYRLDAARLMLYRGGEEISLPPKAVRTLAALLERPGEIVSKDELIGQIWADTVVDESNLAHYLHVLRKTLGSRADGAPYIETLRRRGYRFSPAAPVVRETARTGAAAREPAADAAGDEAAAPSAPFAAPAPRPAERTLFEIETRRARRRALAALAGVLALAALVFLYYRRPAAVDARPAGRAGGMSVVNLADNPNLYSAVIARDGRRFAFFEFRDEKYRLYVQPTGQLTRIEVVEPADKLITAATFSPDGEFIYYVSYEKDRLHGTLRRVPALGGRTTAILEDVSSPVSFAPDGAEMVFARFSDETQRWSLVVASSDGLRERTLLTLEAGQVLANGGAWSPDGKTIAFAAIDPAGAANASTTYALRGAAVDTGKTFALAAEKWENCFRMDWLRDGSGLVFIGTRPGDGISPYRDQVYLLSIADGAARRVTNDGGRYESLSLSTTADDALLAVSSSRLSQIYALGADDAPNGAGGAARRLTDGQADGRGGIAPLPGGRIAYTSRTGENAGIWTMRADGTDRRLIFDEYPSLEELRATPDGRYLIFSATRDGGKHLYRIDAAGGNLKQLTAGEGSEIDSTVSPDGLWVYYNSHLFDGRKWVRELRRTAIDGGRTETVGEIRGDVPHLSPDGRFVSTVEDEKILIHSAENGALLETLDAGGKSFLNTGARWTPDGRAVVYRVNDGRGVVNLWQHSLGGGAPRQLTKFTAGAIYFYAYSPAGDALYLARGEPIRNALLIKNFK